MRVNELVHLQLKDIDFECSTFTIRHTKNRKERKIPVHPVTMEYIRQYIIDHSIFDEEAYIFANQKKVPIGRKMVYTAFRRILLIAGIPHEGKGKGPRVHSFRHTFCVHRLRDWILDGKDVNTLFPYLLAYMGHSTTKSTEYYIRLTADVFPNIILKAEKYFNERNDDYDQ